METREALIERNLIPGRGLADELRLAQKAGVEIVTLADPAYPALLKTIVRPPPVLYVKGKLLPEDDFAVAMVGTRSATLYGLSTAKRLAAELARAGVTVVSGLAEGIDGAAHTGALEGQGRTIAVLGHGLSYLYPTSHRKLAQQITNFGALVSQFPMEATPSRYSFPVRNRVIAGLSLGVVVVEAPLGSGALITAGEAVEMDREVFAVPGPITSPQSQGCHELLKEGAKLVQSVGEILEELVPQLKSRLSQFADYPSAVGPTLTAEESVVFKAIPPAGATEVDTLASATSLAPHRLLSLLTELELKGLVAQVPGQGYSRL